MHAPSSCLCSRATAMSLNMRHQWSRRQCFEGKITALSDPTDEEIAPVPAQAELIETGHAAHLHGQGSNSEARREHSISPWRRPHGAGSPHRIV